MTDMGWMRALPDGKPVSALGFGCSSLWAKPGFDEDRAQRVLQAALDGGINHFDTSPSYGEGVGEERLGRFLKNRDAGALVISTKVGNNLVDGHIQRGFTRDLMQRSFEGSLRRLGVERVDMLYLHGPSLAELESDDVQRFFEDQKKAGRIGFSGVESGAWAVIERAGDTAIDAVMPHFNVSHPSLAPGLARLHARGKIVMTGTVLAQMKFDLKTFAPTSGKSLWYLLRMAKNDPLFWWHGPRLARQLRMAGRSPREAAIAFVLDHPFVTSGLFGSSNPDHVAANALTGHQRVGR
jgi:D-threo-aldose 1-dehydrogenase